MTHFWHEDFVPDELKKGGSLEQEVKTWISDLEHNGEVQIWQTNNVLHVILKPTYVFLHFCHPVFSEIMNTL